MIAGWLFQTVSLGSWVNSENSSLLDLSNNTQRSRNNKYGHLAFPLPVTVGM